MEFFIGEFCKTIMEINGNNYGNKRLFETDTNLII